MKVPKEIQQLTAEIMDTFPQAQIDFDPLPSGVCWLNVWFGRRNFEMEYTPTRGTGVSENFDDTPPFIGHDVAFDSLPEAVRHFKSLLADAARTEANYLPKALVLREENSSWNKKQ
jgi:hypothetical protein